MRPSPSTSLAQPQQSNSTHDFYQAESPNGCYFSYTQASKIRARANKKPRPRASTDNMASNLAETKTQGVCILNGKPGVAPAPSPPQSRSPPCCTCGQLPKLQVPPTPAPTATLTPTYGSTTVGAIPGYSISPRTTLNRDVTSGVPRIFPRPSITSCPHHDQVPSPKSPPCDRTLAALRFACSHTPPRILPAPPPLSARLRSKWAAVQAAEARAKDLADESCEAESCTKLPRRKRTIRRPAEAASTIPPASTIPAGV